MDSEVQTAAQIRFSYLTENFSLSDDVYEMLLEETTSIQGEVETVVKSMVKIGVCLHRVRANIARGAWYHWLSEEFAWTDRTAQRWIAVVKNLSRYGMLEGFLTGEYDAERLALYELSSNNVTDEVRTAAFARVMGGDKLTYRSVAVMTQSFHDLTRSASLASESPESVQKALELSEEAVDPNIIPFLNVLDADDPEAMEAVAASGAVDMEGTGTQVPLALTRPADLMSLINFLKGENEKRDWAEWREEFTVARLRVKENLVDGGGSVSLEYYRPDGFVGTMSDDGELTGGYPEDFLYVKTWSTKGEQILEVAVPATDVTVSFVE